MLDKFLVLSKGGVVYWHKDFCAVSGDPVGALVREVLLEERASETSFTTGPYAVKWLLSNSHELVFVAVYQKGLPLTYVDELLTNVKKLFIRKYGEALKECKTKQQLVNIEFALPEFDELRLSAEVAAQARRRRGPPGAKTAAAPREQAAAAGSDDSDSDSEKPTREAGSPAPNAAGSDAVESTPEPVRIGKPSLVSPRGAANTPAPAPAPAAGGNTTDEGNTSVDEDVVEDSAAAMTPEQRRAAALQRLQQRRGGRTAPAPAPSPAKPGSGSKAGGKKPKEARETERISTRVTAADINKLDRSRSEDAAARNAATLAKYGGDSGSGSDDDKEDEKADSWFGKSAIGGFFKSLTGNQVVTEADMEPVMAKVRARLIEKNVATEIADALCESVTNSLVGRKTERFTSLAATVNTALQDAIARILTPKQSIDVLAEIRRARARGEPYSIVFVGINGVGKSTSLAKVCRYVLNDNNNKVMIAACDTFRSGAVEQLQTHAGALGVPVYERGYARDPAMIAQSALKYAKENGFHVVLIDTAGRMQNNEGLMRELAKLVSTNNPNLVLFVGEALVGNSGVEQLVEFNRAMIDNSDSTKPRIVDGIVLTKFDTIDDKVGAALSMCYKSGQPIMFVGTGQKYSDLKQLNVGSVVKALCS